MDLHRKTLRHSTSVGFAVIALTFGCAADSSAAEKKGGAATGKTVTAVLKTDKGEFTLELFPDKAPKTVANFLDYARAGFYDGTIFHRVVQGFVVQGGGFTPNMVQKETKSPVVNESSNRLKNVRGTVAMARQRAPDTATSQFYINLSDNAALDYGANGPDVPGYTVFARVTQGLDVIDAIAKSPVGNQGRFANVPKTPIRITSVQVKGKS